MAPLRIESLLVDLGLREFLIVCRKACDFLIRPSVGAANIEKAMAVMMIGDNNFIFNIFGTKNLRKNFVLICYPGAHEY